MRTTFPRNAEIFILGAAVPALPEAELRAFCHARETALAPWLGEEQTDHIRRFALSGAALAARASRVLARGLLLRGLSLAAAQTRSFRSEGVRLQADSAGRPVLPGWAVSFSHSGRAAFCALRPGPAANGGPSGGPPHPAHPALGLDAEALDSPPPCGRAFASGEIPPALSATGQCREALRRWTIKEALLKALGTGLARDAARIFGGRCGGRAGHAALDGHCLRWFLLPCPGHWLCLATSAAVSSPTFRFFWQTRV
ncbi:4'-phosphopantetheinyl transferase superfamily protein [Desulfovibrio sp. ZJ369]|uniref:4'-phosphopantetheinyl transferase family protein n=1 Tax=Desulfovibrio sp. ZJ369 TaxID=2709793 RepID=UPI0019824B0A|nr:4'-phosphopantetheinyl transferase superfamily protein [Desulfovibrio sp. ZJ369]